MIATVVVLIFVGMGKSGPQNLFVGDIGVAKATSGPHGIEVLIHEAFQTLPVAWAGCCSGDTRVQCIWA